jgi:hypothetical protein
MVHAPEASASAADLHAHICAQGRGFWAGTHPIMVAPTRAATTVTVIGALYFAIVSVAMGLATIRALCVGPALALRAE